jgi:16S rRNA (adenine1518-N6/adenine1519-N6)-dimethyltransferase
MIRAKKHLGQHFLKNESVAQRIAESLTGDGYDSVLEIGPGMGVLTQFLLPGPWHTKVAEIDGESVMYLEEHYQEALHGNIIPGDFLQLPLADIFEKPFALIGNYPYNISSQIIFKMLENKEWIPEMVGMFQKEVAERLVAEPGSKTYGILSVLSAAFYDREYLFTVEPHEFNPPPKVRSGVIRFKRKASQETLDCDAAKFKMVVKMAFNQRRKTLRNALKGLNLPVDSIPQEFWAKRAEQLHYLQFVTITKAFEHASESR